MRKAIPIICIVLLINLLFGYLYQISNEVVCFTELMLLGIGGLIFWLGSFKPLKQFVKFSCDSKGLYTSNLIKYGVVGIVVAIVNLFFCYFFLKATMFTLFGCESPAFQLLNASLTNSLIGNFLCYSCLVFFIVHKPTTNLQQASYLESMNKKEAGKVGSPSTNADFTSSLKNYLLLTDNKKNKVKVKINTISHLTVEANCISIHCQDRKFVKYQSLKSFHQTLPQGQFVRIHRSTVINIDFIASINSLPSGDGQVYLKDGTRLRYSRNYKKQLHLFI